jgi:histidine ammonia-lyase
VRTYRQPGTILTDHHVSVPLDHGKPDGDRIEVFGREVVATRRAGDRRLPWLVFLQGGPGMAAQRPVGRSTWLDRALDDYRVLLLDQRGTGRSTPLTARSLARLGTPAAQAEYLAHFRADSIVLDCELVRRQLCGADEPWTVLGQSFGGFCAVTYLSFAPHGLAAALITGGLPGLGTSAEDVYRITYGLCADRCAAHYERYPGDIDAARDVARQLATHDVRLADGSPLTVERFQSIGGMLGSSAGTHELHYLLEDPWDGDGGLSDTFLSEIAGRTSFARAPLYAVLHEACYAQGAATRWAAQRVRAEFPAFDPAAAVDGDAPLLFTGEMVYPWMVDIDPALAPLREAAELLAQRDGWPPLYDPARLAATEVPVAAAVYHDDLYVPAPLALRTAAAIRGLRAWVTNEWEHEGLRISGGKVLARLIAMNRDEVLSMDIMETETVIAGTGPLSFADVIAVARGGAAVALSQDAEAAVAAGRKVIDALAHDSAPHYGVSTGFGALATKHIPAERRAQLQRSLVRSHAAGSGPEVEAEVVRAMMLLRLSTLATGRTGVRPAVARTYAAMLGAGITPVVREHGSLGCSGDLAPLAHCALAAMGEGTVRVAGPDPALPGTLLPAGEALAAAGIAPLVLAEKEGLALINGTDGMLGMLILAAEDLRVLLQTADITAAMSVEALLGTDAPFDAGLQALRPHPGQAASAANLRLLLDGSPIVASHRGPADTRVQDAYSLRCAPQVHGAARDTLAHARAVAGRELASAIDNPVVTLDGHVVSNGNFHGAPVGYVLDFLAIVAADVASIAERRTDRMLDAARSHGLPPFLADDPGVDSGHMIAQYTQAAVVSELKRLAVPASVDSIPSSAMQEDHVSMGWSAARKLRRAVDGLTRVLAIELLTAARGLELRAPLQPAAATGAVVAGLRAGDDVRPGVAGPGTDRFLSPEIEAAVGYVASGAAVRAAETVTGPLE